ncbi:MAG TPA: LPS-assembly protein LptD [Firmicutes bacterium]|nr:LPS-assembly protein LptD [Bacillota bacterium]
MRLQLLRQPLLFFYLIMLCLLCGRIGVTYAANVSITGADAAVYDQVTGSFVFQGDIVITTGDTTIKAGYVIYDGTNNRLDIRGPLTITYDGATLAGRDLSYQIDTNTGSLKQAQAEMTPASAVSPMYLLGDEVTTCSERTVLSGAKVTTCDPAAPGYYLSAAVIEIYPEDRIVLYQVRFVESGLTLFYWPRLTFSLKAERDDEFTLPQIGHSANEGWYVKSKFRYQGPWSQHGELHLDYMQYLGWGFGVSHVLRTDDKGTDKFHLYVQPNKKSGHTDLTLTFDEQRTYGKNINVTLHSGYKSTGETQGERRQFSNRIAISQSRTGGSTSVSYNDLRYWGVQPGYDTSGSVNHTQTLFGDWRLRLNGTLHKRDLANAKYRNLMGYFAEITKNTADWSLGLVAEDRFNPDLEDDEVADISWNRARRLPELTVRINRFKLFGWETPFTFDAAWGMLTENRQGSSISTERVHVAGRIKPQKLNMKLFGEFTWSGSLIRRWYGTGESQWVAGSQTNYSLPITKALVLTGNHAYEQAFGDVTPFHFDRVSYREQISGRLSYQSNALQVSASTGYNLVTKRLHDVVASLRYSPTAKMRFQLQTAYSLENQIWNYVVGTVQLSPCPAFTLNLGAKYNMIEQRPDRIDAEFFWDLGGWELGYTAIYDGTKNQFERGDFIVTRDLDCRAFDIRYNQVDKAIWLEYRITAFPKAGVKVGASDTSLMFDARGWEELLADE